jgi:hypothetical protein
VLVVLLELLVVVFAAPVPLLHAATTTPATVTSTHR